MSTPPPGSLEEFISSDQYNLEQISQNLPYFSELVPRLDALYECSLKLLPIANSEVSAALNQFLLLSHKGFLSAAVTIGRRHPDDAAAITRRAIEAARLAMAIKHDPANLERWKDYEVRLARWADRRAGKIPKPLRVRLL